jgi:hypothetical protein
VLETLEQYCLSMTLFAGRRNLDPTAAAEGLT